METNQMASSGAGDGAGSVSHPTSSGPIHPHHMAGLMMQMAGAQAGSGVGIRAMAPSSGGNPSVPRTFAPGTAASALGRDQGPEKKRKCVSCGNTAQSRCDFHSCGTCCVKNNKNLCSAPGHGGKFIPDRNPAYFNRPEAMWSAAVTGMPLMSYMRPSPGAFVPTSMVQGFQQGGSFMGFPNPYLKMQTPSSSLGPGKLAEGPNAQELRLKNYKASLQAAQKEATFVNIWRIQKLREYFEGEQSFEDEAFDRYVQNASYLEEVLLFSNDMVSDETLSVSDFALESSTDSIQNKQLLNKMLARLLTDPKRKEIQRQKLKRVIERSLLKLNKGDFDDTSDAYEVTQIGLLGGRRDAKRMKVRSLKGKECVQRMNACEELQQRANSIANPQDIHAWFETYKTNFDHDIRHYFYPSSRDFNSDVLVSESEATTQTHDKPENGAVLGSSDMVKVQGDQEGKPIEHLANRNTDAAVVEESHKKSFMRTMPRSHASKNKGILAKNDRFLKGLGSWKVEGDPSSLQKTCQELSDSVSLLQEL